MNFEEFKKRALDLSELELEESLRQLEDLIIGFFTRKHIPNLQSFQEFVVRCSINDPGEVFKNISRCSYNPEPKNIGLQRCNYPGQQIFYCSMYSDTDLASTSMTCIVETAWEHIEKLDQKRTYCTLSRWECKRPLTLWVLPFSDESSRKNRDFAKIRENMTKLISKDHRSTEDSIKSLEFISSAFAERKNKKAFYRITSAFYNSLLFFERSLSQEYDGLMYPSANTEGAGLNLAIKKDLVEKGVLTGYAAVMYVIERSPNNPKNLTAIPVSNEAYVEKGDKIRFTTIF